MSPQLQRGSQEEAQIRLVLALTEQVGGLWDEWAASKASLAMGTAGSVHRATFEQAIDRAEDALDHWHAFQANRRDLGNPIDFLDAVVSARGGLALAKLTRVQEPPATLPGV